MQTRLLWQQVLPCVGAYVLCPANLRVRACFTWCTHEMRSVRSISYARTTVLRRHSSCRTCSLGAVRGGSEALGGKPLADPGATAEGAAVLATAEVAAVLATVHARAVEQMTAEAVVI